MGARLYRVNLAALALNVAACGPIVPPDEPTFSKHYPVEYTSLAACFFDRIRTELAGVSMADIRANETILFSLEVSGFRGIEITVSKTGDRASLVTVKELAGLLTGPAYSTRTAIAPAFEACGAALTTSPLSQQPRPTIPRRM